MMVKSDLEVLKHQKSQYLTRDKHSMRYRPNELNEYQEMIGIFH